MPHDVETLKRLVLARDAELARARAEVSSAEALIAHLRLAIDVRRRFYELAAAGAAPIASEALDRVARLYAIAGGRHGDDLVGATRLSARGVDWRMPQRTWQTQAAG